VTAAEARLKEGLAHHRAGRVDRARECYQALLQGDPNHADANHLMGVLALQDRRWKDAEALIATALAANAKVAPYHDHLGVAFRNQGRLADAEACHRRALAIDPKSAAALNNLATTLREAGRIDEARDCARRAMAAAPKDPVICANAGTLFLETGSFGPAADAFARAAEAKPDVADYHEKMGLARYRAGRVAEAEQAFRRTLELAPDHAQARRWLAETLLTLECPEDARAEARAQLEGHPDDEQAMVLEAVAAWRSGDVAGAGEVYRRVLDRAPANTAALTGLAVVEASRGDIAAARAGYRRVLDVDPGNVDAYGNLAMLGAGELTVADAERMAGLLRGGKLPDDQRAVLAFALAHFLAAAGERAAAFDWYRTGNLMRRAHLQAGGHRFDAALHESFLDARQQVFTPAFFAARQGFGSDSERPVFIVGLPRSGTTLVEQILAAHGQVHGAGELRDMAITALARLPALTGGEKTYPSCVQDLAPDAAGNLAEAYLARLAEMAAMAGKADARRVIDKMPFNYLHLGLIHLLFPNARIIHCRRDARDVGLSCFTTNFTDAHAWTTDLGEIAAYINGYERLMAHWRNVLPGGVMTEVRYEDLVADVEAESRRLVSFIGLRWRKACLDFHKAERVVTTASRAQVRQPIYARSVGRWKAYGDELAPLLDALG